MSENQIPSPSHDDISSTQAFEQTKEYQNRTITCVINGYEGVPVDARMFAKLIITQIKLLESIEKNTTGKTGSIWTLSELAVIDNKASFTITGVSREWFNDTLKKAKAAKRREGAVER